VGQLHSNTYSQGINFLVISSYSQLFGGVDGMKASQAELPMFS
jgi:hypothetical protein